MEERIASLHQGALSYLYREGKGPTLILLHGAGHRAAHLLPLAEALPGREIVIPDARGRGKSAGRPAENLQARGEEVRELIDVLGLEKIVVSGHSLGGALALEIGLFKLPVVRGLILIATGARLRVHPAIIEAVRAGGPSNLPFSPYSPEFPESERLRFAALEESVPTESALSDWTVANAFDRMSAIASIDVPARVIVGSADRMTPPKYSEYLASKMPQAELSLIEGAGHMLPMERPADVAEVMERFLSDRLADPRGA